MITAIVLISRVQAAQFLLRRLGVKPAGHDTVHSEEELKLIVTQSYESGEINQTELDYLKNIFAFDDRILKDIMIPESEIVMLNIRMPKTTLTKVHDEYDYTRYPVANDENKGNIIGYINTKEILTSMAAGIEVNMDNFIHEMPRFLETSLIKDVLLKMQESRVHMASYG
nr:hypothetical protein [Cytobacillus oceanisediminis]